MALWGNTDANADEPKNLSTGEFQGTAGKAIYGVDNAEQSVANAASGDARLYAPPHAGWVGINTYTDMHGNFRVKTETLVAMSSLTGDQNTDDTVFADT